MSTGTPRTSPQPHGSANVTTPPALFLSLFMTGTMSATEIPCGNGKGESDTPFGNKAWVLVRKGGGTAVIKAKYSRIGVVFNQQGFDNSNLTHKPEIMEL